jgi:hypothetical protein
MSIHVANKEGTTQLWHSKIFFPKNNYAVRIVDETNKPSAKGSPMVTLEFEIVNSEPVKIGDFGMVEFDGVTFKKYMVTWGAPDSPSNKFNAEQAQKNFNRYDEFLKACGIDTSNGWDYNNPPSVVGKVLFAQLYGKETVQRRTPTDEEKQSPDENIRLGEILKDPITGKEVRGYQIDVAQFYGICTDEVRPF